MRPMDDLENSHMVHHLKKVPTIVLDILVAKEIEWKNTSAPALLKFPLGNLCIKTSKLNTLFQVKHF